MMIKKIFVPFNYFFILMAIFVSSKLFAHGISVSDKALMHSGGLLEYIYLGAIHMITGYDHLLFLLGVIFFLNQFKDIVKFITAFTLGHSITLIFATLFHISANYFLIDAVIALSVCYKGFENMDGFKKYLNCKSPHLLYVVFLFGLIHGFGLSTRLQQLHLGKDALIMKILSFNVGVELGQILALTVIFLALVSFKKTRFFNAFSLVSNMGLLIIGFLLFIMQMHGFLHSSHPDDFGFNNKYHIKAHQNSEFFQQQTDQKKFKTPSKGVHNHHKKQHGSPTHRHGSKIHRH